MYTLLFLIHNDRNNIMANNRLGLHWDDRPPEIKERITEAFKRLNERSSWLCDGQSSQYNIANIDEYVLVENLIRQNPERDDFYVLDIGSAKFGFGQSLSKHLEKAADLKRENLTVHIISLSGEAVEPKLIENNICKVYNIGSFVIENMLKDPDLSELQKKIDIAVSHMCFVHLVDPLGTLLQAYEMLRPKTGLLLMDGFFYAIENELMFDENMRYMGRLLSLIDAPFLYYAGYGISYPLGHFIIQRRDEERLVLPLAYNNVKSEEKPGIASQRISVFTWLEAIPPFSFEDTHCKNFQLCGDKSLYDFLLGAGAIRGYLGMSGSPTPYAGSFRKISNCDENKKDDSMTTGTSSFTSSSLFSKAQSDDDKTPTPNTIPASNFSVKR